MKNKPSLTLLLLCLFFTSCYRVADNLNPQVSYTVDEKYFDTRPSAFIPLSEEEKAETWGQEYLIAQQFAKELDLYRAVTTFKRAEFLLPPQNLTRKQEIQYDILLSYYLGKKYEEVAENFERSELLNVDQSFTAFHDLLVILYDSYNYLNDKEKVGRIEEILQKSYPQTENQLKLSDALSKGEVKQAKKQAAEVNPLLYSSIEDFEKKRKSVRKAQALNAVLPGAGYLYIGQKKSAVTAFLINSLFIGAIYEFFHRGNIPAAVIATSFEMGWYFGGIYGAGEEAKFYNERLYEKEVGQTMNHEGVFPLYRLEYHF